MCCVWEGDGWEMCCRLMRCRLVYSLHKRGREARAMRYEQGRNVEGVEGVLRRRESKQMERWKGSTGGLM